MPDRGNPEAKILFIGEAPGAEEDKAGRSFVGRSGKLLDKLMESIGLDTNRDVLITNVVKCRPPDNRVPTATEALACAPYLKKQIALLEPSLIVLLGATAFRRMAPDRDFGAEVGKIFDLSWEGRRIPCLPLFHPAYLLYDPRKRETMAGYLATLNKFVRENALIGNSR